MNALTEAFSRSETGSHPVARSDLLISCRGGPLEQVLLRGGLYAVFQPIVHLGQAHVYAHEALIRGPRGSPLHTPDALLRAAAEEGLGFEFEYACVQVALQTWAQCKTPGRLFIFLGHVGGDDFLLLFQSVDWQERCENIVRDFNAHAFDMFDSAARSAGGAYARAEDVANLAAVAKHQAKMMGSGVHVLKC